MSYETVSSSSYSEQTRSFHIGDILSITTKVLLSPRRIDGVYDILDYMTGADLMTHQLIRAARVCDPVLRNQHPDLSRVEVPNRFENEEEAYRWLGEVVLQYGETREVAPLSPGEYAAMDPIEEFVAVREAVRRRRS